MKKNTFITTLLFMIIATSLCNSQKIVAEMVDLKSNNSQQITPIVAITGTNNETSEGFSFVALTEISAGTIIYFTDKEFDNTTLTFNTYESVASWTAPNGGIFRGEVIVVKETTTANVYTTYCNSGNCGSVTQISGNFALTAKGETFYAYSDSNSDPTDGIKEIYAVLYTGNSSISGGNIPTIEDPSTIYIGVVVVDGFSTGSIPNRTEYKPSLRNVSVDQINFQNTANWLHAQINQDLSAIPFTNVIIVNTPPTFTSTPVLALKDNETYTYNITSNDVDGNVVTVTATTIPSWLTLNSAETVLSGSAAGQVGTYLVVLNADDGNGGTDTQSFTITISDGTPPTIVTQNNTIQLDEFGTALTITAADVDNGSIDASSIATMTIDNDTFDCSNVGENTVILTVTDINGNSASATALVTVEDRIAPAVVTVAPFTIQLDKIGNNISIVASDIDNGSTDNCGIDAISIDIDTFTCSDVGANTVTLTVTDMNGNSATAEAIVTVEDSVVPTVITQDITAELDANGNASIIPEQIDNGSTDNCSIANYILDITDFTCESIGENTVTLTVTDINGNSTTAEAIVTVVDSVAPTVVIQDITVQLDASGNASITSSQIDNGSIDNCSIATYVLDTTDFTCENVGENTITLTVTDINGNSSTGSATVTIEDGVAPTVVTVTPFTIQLDEIGNNISIVATDIDNGSTDNCGISTISIDIDTFTCENVGENTITLTATDENGNRTIGTTVVTIEDVTAPVVITQDITVELNSRGDAFITLEEINNGSIDNCGIVSMSLDRTEFECATLGDHTVILTVTDISGNTASETAIVTLKGDDIDGDLIADNCDEDMDGDGVENDFDNCPQTYNSDQRDIDFNGVGDVCDESSLTFAEGLGFSPNGDGIRDTFIIKGLHEFPDNELELYNRWGTKVFGAKPYQNNWDGIARGSSVFNKGERLPAGPYFYVLTVSNNRVFKGWIYINY
jgi:gliding motility-associated-like protein